MAFKVDNFWMEEVKQIKNEVKKHLSNLYKEEEWERPLLDGVNFKNLNEEQKTDLVKRFSQEELEEVVLSFDGNKSPGSDGFNFKFIQEFMTLLKEEIWVVVNEFFETKRIPKGFTSYFVALIPKISNPQVLSDFRPISPMDCLYKIISKLLANRLKKVMESLISCNQSTFIAKINILDGVVVINEVVDFVKKKKKECLFVKVDFEKAYGL